MEQAGKFWEEKMQKKCFTAMVCNLIEKRQLGQAALYFRETTKKRCLDKLRQYKQTSQGQGSLDRKALAFSKKMVAS